MHISKAEESAMEISEECTDQWREENTLPGSDDIQEAQAMLEPGIPKRGRAPSAAEADSQSRRKTARTR